MKSLRRTILTLLLIAPSALLAESPGPDGLETAWNRYRDLFRSPRDILFEIQTPNDPAILERVADFLRSHPQVEDAFVVERNVAADTEQAGIYLLLNSTPVEFGAWLEKLQPRLVRQEFRKFIKLKSSAPPDSPECFDKDPLGLKNFIAIRGSVPLFKQPIPTGVFARLQSGIDARHGERIWGEQGAWLEHELRAYFDRAGYNRVELERLQDLPVLPPDTRSLMIGFWLAAAVVGSSLFAICTRRFGPYLALLFVLGMVVLLTSRLAPHLPSFLDVRLIPAGASILLFWGMLAFRGDRAEPNIRGRMVALILAGIAGVGICLLAPSGTLRQLGLFLVILPAGLAGLLLLFGLDWAGADEPDRSVPSGFFSALEQIFWARKNALLLVCMAALSGLLLWQAARQHSLRLGISTPSKRAAATGVWTLAADHSLNDRTLFLLAEGQDWGEILFQLGAQRFALSAAKRDQLLDRQWTPSRWVPRPAWQRSNADDFLRKRNMVVIERIAKQEGLSEIDLAPTLQFLNRVGTAAVSLASGDKAQWVPSDDRDAFGLRLRSWVRQERNGSCVTLSYTWPAPARTDPTVMTWITEALRPFGVHPAWVAPGLLEQRAIKESLIAMLCIVLVLLLVLALMARVDGAPSIGRTAAATFLFLGSWFLTLVGLGWAWAAGGPALSASNGLWVWTSVLTWHVALILAWLRRDGRRNTGLFASTLTAASTLLTALILWPELGSTGGATRALLTGIFWSTAWTLLLARPTAGPDRSAPSS